MRERKTTTLKAETNIDQSNTRSTPRLQLSYETRVREHANLTSINFRKHNENNIIETGMLHKIFDFFK